MIQGLKNKVRNLIYEVSKINVPFLLVALIPILGELHHFWDNDNTQRDVFLLIDYKLWTAWIVSQVASQVQYCIVCYLVFWFSKRARVPKSLSSIFLAIFIQSLLDIVMYFLTFKTEGYSMVFYVIAIVVVFAPVRRKRHNN